ncbi:conserved hypothetical protein [Vibrio crassostreae]|nr:conserved hypothetical protein [Vibrio crassostreae]CAK3522358.1 conserved hypothetical protein [Vibrio crassostreae]
MLAILASIFNFAIDVQLYKSKTAAITLLSLTNNRHSIYVLDHLDDERRQ